jgi:hypothetical protein
MTGWRRMYIALIALAVFPAVVGLAIDVNDTKLLREPAISERNIAFV